MADYTREPLALRARKALRFARLEGPRGATARIRAQLHKHRTYETLPPIPEGPGHGHVGILGCGQFAHAIVARELRTSHPGRLRGAMDRNLRRAASLFESYGLSYYTDDAERIFDDPAIDLVFVTSDHGSHADYAIRALERGKSVHIEKPHVTNRAQLVRLCRAMGCASGRVTLGFNRPRSPLAVRAREALAAEPGPGSYGWFVAAPAPDPSHWYHAEQQAGILADACHWIEFLYRLVPEATRYPIQVRALSSPSGDDASFSLRFGDGSLGQLTYSRKGRPFDGMRERFTGHRGDTLVTLDDFHCLNIDVGATRRRMRFWFRDYGHAATIAASYATSGAAGGAAGDSVSTVWETGELLLACREALAAPDPILVAPFSPEKLASAEA